MVAEGRIDTPLQLSWPGFFHITQSYYARLQPSRISCCAGLYPLSKQRPTITSGILILSQLQQRYCRSELCHRKEESQLPQVCPFLAAEVKGPWFSFLLLTVMMVFGSTEGTSQSVMEKIVTTVSHCWFEQTILRMLDQLGLGTDPAG